MKTIVWIACLILAANVSMAQHAVKPDAFEKGAVGKDVQLLDVRTAKEFKTGHLKDALQADFTNKEEFFGRIKALDKNKPVYIYCLSGGRSTAAAKWMRDNGFQQVTELEGGVVAWNQDGKKLTGVVSGPQMSIAMYNQAVSSGRWILVDVGADWCPPCRKMDPVVKQFVKDNNLKVVNVDGGKDTDVMKNIAARELPTFILYKDGKEVWRKEGIVSREEFNAAIK